MEGSDFWWLPEDVKETSLLVKVGYHRPLTDDDDPQSVQWFHSLNTAGQLSTCQQLYPLDFLIQWRRACRNTNVYRSLTLFDIGGKPVLLGSFLIDIDNSEWADGYTEDLEDALHVARIAVKILTRTYSLVGEDVRIFFSGRKGFNIEVRSAALGISGSFGDQVRGSCEKLDQIIKALRQANNVTNSTTNVVSNQRTVIDRVHGSKRSGYGLKHTYVRLHDSINKWVQKNENETARMRIELSLNDLCNRNVRDIFAEAERLASDNLGSR